MPDPVEPLLASVWQELSADLRRLVGAMGIDRGQADDVLQDVYLTAWQKHPAGVDRSELRRWLLRVTANRCNLEHRRKSRWQAALERLRQSAGRASRVAEPAADASRREELEAVRRALGALAPQLRTVLVLRYFAELDSREIGRILGMPDSTVRSHLRAGRKRLASALKRSGFGKDEDTGNDSRIV